MKTAVIIGGNQSGLNMARCLADVGFQVTLFEKKSAKRSCVRLDGRR